MSVTELNSSTIPEIAGGIEIKHFHIIKARRASLELDRSIQTLSWLV